MESDSATKQRFKDEEDSRQIEDQRRSNRSFAAVLCIKNKGKTLIFGTGSHGTTCAVLIHNKMEHVGTDKTSGRHTGTTGNLKGKCEQHVQNCLKYILFSRIRESGEVTVSD